MDAKKAGGVVKRIIVGTLIVITMLLAFQRAYSWLGIGKLNPPKGLKVYVR